MPLNQISSRVYHLFILYSSLLLRFSVLTLQTKKVRWRFQLDSDGPSSTVIESPTRKANKMLVKISKVTLPGKTKSTSASKEGNMSEFPRFSLSSFLSYSSLSLIRISREKILFELERDSNYGREIIRVLRSR